MADRPRLIFLDIDGVLNNARPAPQGEARPMFDPANVRAFNRIVSATGARVVVSSSWRGIVARGDMTLAGFEMLLLTHRVRCKVVGITPFDARPRGDQIADYLSFDMGGRIGSYLVLDDDDDATSGRHPLVLTDGSLGLTEADADRAIALIGEMEVAAHG